MKHPRPNVRKCDVRQPVWKEWVAWFAVLAIVGALRYTYYVVTGV